MNRTEVLEHIAPLTDMTVRTIDHTPATRVVVTPDMVTLRPGRGGRILELAPEGVKSMAHFVQMPASLASRIRPITFGTVATELLERESKYDLVTREGQVVAFTKPHHHRQLNPDRVLRAVESGIHGSVDYQRVMLLEETAVSLEVIGTHQEAVVRGDLVRAGAMVVFSPIGTVVPQVQSYVMRLACTNGVTSKDVLREFAYTGGDGDDVWQFFRQSVHDAYNSIGGIANRWRQMREEQISPADRALVLEAMLKEARISGKDAETVRALALENPPQNTYDVLNLITYASSHLLGRPEQVRHALDAAASFQEQSEHARICPVCHRTQVN